MDTLTHSGAGWTIRPAAPIDHPGIAEVFLSCLSAFPWRGSPRRELSSMENALLSGECFVAYVPQAGVVGFVIYDTITAYISHLFVDDDWRFCGIGSTLLKLARDVVARPVRLDVDEQNEAALTVYRALGWTEVIETPGPSRGQRRMISP